MGFFGYSNKLSGFIKSCKFADYPNDYQHLQMDTPRMRCPICAFISKMIHWVPCKFFSLYAMLPLFQLRVNFPAWAWRTQSVYLLATGWTVLGSNPSGGEIFRPHPERTWDPPSLMYNRHRASFSWEKRPGRGVEPHPYLTQKLKKE